MSKNDIINKIETQQFNKFPEFSSGDTVEVSVKVKEGKRERVQLYEGVVIANIKVKRKGSVRRAKLYYLRERSGKSARIKEKLN